MKTKLTILSLSPLCLLTFVMNFKFTSLSDDGQVLTCEQFIQTNSLIIVILSACLLWCVGSIFLYIYFKFLVSFGGNGGYTINEISEDKEAGLNFFLTLVLPLLIGDLNEWQNAVAFAMIFVIIFALLMKTDLFYANPVLTLLGYHVYKLTFNDNAKIDGQCIVVATEKITAKDTIEHKHMAAKTDNILFAKIIKRGGNASERT